MKLSDAIRKGAEQLPQAHGVLFERDVVHDGVYTSEGGGMYVRWTCRPIRACALGAAYLGTFGAPAELSFVHSNDEPRFFTELEVAYPKLCSSPLAIPCGHSDQLGHTLEGVIAHLNDQCGWSRERIADWLDTLEDKP